MRCLCPLQVFSTYVPTECVNAGEETARARGRQTVCYKKKTKTRQEDASAWGKTEGSLDWSTEEMMSDAAPGGLWRSA